MAATLTFLGLQLSSWPEPVLFSQITSARMESGKRRDKLILKYRSLQSGQETTAELYPGGFTSAAGALTPKFRLYLQSHKTAEDHARKKQIKRLYTPGKSPAPGRHPERA